MKGYVNADDDGIYYGFLYDRKERRKVVTTASFGVAIGLVIDAIIRFESADDA